MVKLYKEIYAGMFSLLQITKDAVIPKPILIKLLYNAMAYDLPKINLFIYFGLLP